MTDHCVCQLGQVYFRVIKSILQGLSRVYSYYRVCQERIPTIGLSRAYCRVCQECIHTTGFVKSIFLLQGCQERIHTTRSSRVYSYYRVVKSVLQGLSRVYSYYRVVKSVFILQEGYLGLPTTVLGHPQTPIHNPNPNPYYRVVMSVLQRVCQECIHTTGLSRAYCNLECIPDTI